MSLSKPKRESFIDRYQLWPFYRKRNFSEETLEAMREVERKINEGYRPPDDEETHISRNISGTNCNTKYKLVEEPRYLKGRQRMAERGFDLGDLDIAIGLLRRGYKLPSNFKNHKLKGNMRGFMECHIGYDWLLVYRYDHDELILYAVDTGSHEDIFGQ